MRKIIDVFLADLRRISKNIVAIVLIMGLTILPALYAWFNILSNWDPYGENATSKMNIAVFSEDKGVDLSAVKLNVGDSVVNALESNDTIGWKFTKSRDEAMKGLRAGKYYAAILIPEDFTEKLLTFIGGDVENPVIEYYENSKKNAIATKITSKVRNTVQTQVNDEFISTLAKRLMEAGNSLAEGNSTKLITGVKAKLNKANARLNDYSSIVETLDIALTSAESMAQSSEAVTDALENSLKSGATAVGNSRLSLEALEGSVDSAGNLMDISFDAVSNSIKTLSAQIDSINNNTDIEILRQSCETTVASVKTLTEMLDQIAEKDPAVGGAIGNEIKNLKEHYLKLSRALKQLDQIYEKSDEKAENLKKSINKSLKSISSSVDKLQKENQEVIIPALKTSIAKADGLLADAESLIGNITEKSEKIGKEAEKYDRSVDGAKESVDDVRKDIKRIQGKLNRLSNGIEILIDGHGHDKIMSILNNDPDSFAEFLVSPLRVETEELYPIESYGSAMSPFYTVLALWVGALILSAIIHVRVKPEKGLENLKPYHEFFGRYITFFLISQAQNLLIILGNLYFINIQCPHPFKLWLAGAVTALVFSLFIYSLTYAMGNIGQALALIILVIQVAGAGGTFPVEVLPYAYQATYKYMPFNYAMNAMRECVGGCFGNDYWEFLGILSIYILIALVIGLVMHYPFKRLTDKIEKSKEKSGLML